MKILLLSLTVVFTTALHAKYPYQTYIGEESYMLWRLRQGGSCQKGRIDGVRIGIDRLKRYGWYVGGDYLYATGSLKGKTGQNSPIASDYTDQIFEARFGYTLQKKNSSAPFFTPFIGWGFFQARNSFYPPSYLTCTFTDSFNFVTIGFLSGVNLTPLLSMGINFKVRFMQHAQSKITKDLLFDDIILTIEDETHYRLELPLTLTPRSSCLGLGGQLTPFYAFRHFGGREGYPFNFKDTKFHLAGIRLSLVYRF